MIRGCLIVLVLIALAVFLIVYFNACNCACGGIVI